MKHLGVFASAFIPVGAYTPAWGLFFFPFWVVFHRCPPTPLHGQPEIGNFFPCKCKKNYKNVKWIKILKIFSLAGACFFRWSIATFRTGLVLGAALWRLQGEPLHLTLVAEMKLLYENLCVLPFRESCLRDVPFRPWPKGPSLQFIYDYIDEPAFVYVLDSFCAAC